MIKPKVTKAKTKRKKPGPLSKAEKEKLLKKLTYNSWSMMLQRCMNENHVSYKEYGGRGISVHTGWIPSVSASTDGYTRAHALACFIRDVGLRPSQKHTLDRLDANGHYMPDNVKWATAIEQGSNKRTTHYVRHPVSGARIAAAYLAREKGMTYQALRVSMLKAGTWFVETFSDQPTIEKPLPKER